MTGSFSSVLNSSAVYTSYEILYKQNFIYKDAFEACLKDYECSKNFVNEAKIYNDIVNEIYTNKTTTDEYKTIEYERFSGAFKEKSDILYEFYHNYFMHKKNETIFPREPFDFMDAGGHIVTFYDRNMVRQKYVNPAFINWKEVPRYTDVNT